MPRPAREGAWFVRIRRRGAYNITPCTPQGWVVTITYCLFALVITPIIDPPIAVHVAVWLTLFVAATALFVIVAWRTSAPAADDSQKGSN